MKSGYRPPYAGARRGILPEHPTYWPVTPDIEAAVKLLVEAGQVEYEPSFARGTGGQFAVEAPALELVASEPTPPPAPAAAAFARKKGR